MSDQPYLRAVARRSAGAPHSAVRLDGSSLNSSGSGDRPPSSEGPSPGSITAETARCIRPVNRESAFSGHSRHRVPPVAILLCLGLASMFLVSGVPLAAPSVASHLSPSVSTPLTLTLNGVAAKETPDFWGTFISGTSVNHFESGLLNATPIKFLRFGANQIEQENWSNGCMYSDSGSCQGLQENVAAFATLCQWIPSDSCDLGVPAETNSPSTVAYLMNWLKAETGWTPGCWSVGNEPQGWIHFNIPWTSWKSSDHSVPTATQYASLAQNMTDTIRHLDPGACVVGIESEGNKPSRVGSWFQAIDAAAPNVTLLAYHNYPNEWCTGENASQLFAPAKLTQTVTTYHSYAVPGAAGIPVEVHEFNIGLHGCDGFDGTPTDAVYTSANVAQALEAGMPEFTFFRFFCGASDCLYNSSSNEPTPVYTLYSKLFTHLDIRTIRNVTVSGGADQGTFAAEGSDNTTDASLLFSNANETTGESLSLAGMSPTNWTGEVYTMDSNGDVSNALYVPGMTVALPPGSTVVVKMYQAAGGGSTGSSPDPWAIDGTVELANSSVPAGLTAQLNFTLENGSTFQLVTAVGPTGNFSIDNLTFAGTFAAARLGPGRTRCRTSTRFCSSPSSSS